MTKQELCQKARDMLPMAYVPYSHFPVGAALECEDGTVFTGCNIENAGYTPTNCAERTAVAADTERFTAPCGVCRQVLAEFNPELTMEVILVNREGKTLELTLRDLLPYSFDSSYLGQ